jgi:hypothetical protein
MEDATELDIQLMNWVFSEFNIVLLNCLTEFEQTFSPITELELEIPDIDPNAGRKQTTTTTKKPFSDSSFIGNKYLPPSNQYLPPSNEYLPPSTNDITRDLLAPTL